MSRKSQPKKVQLWTDRLSRFVKSEQTVRQFCRSKGISLPSFYQWKKKLATSDDSVAASAELLRCDEVNRKPPRQLGSPDR